jgi:hypothetical protein
MTAWMRVSRPMTAKLRSDISEENRQLFLARLGKGPYRVLAMREYEMNWLLERQGKRKRYLLKLRTEWGDEAVMWAFNLAPVVQEKVNWPKDGF